MTLKERLKASAKALFGRDTVEQPPISVRSFSLSSDSAEGRALMEAMARGDQSGIMAAIHAARERAQPEPQGAEQVAALAAFGNDGAASTLEWRMWENEMRLLTEAAPGWAPCRFYRRISDSEGVGVFGIANGHFGIWREPYHVCNTEEHEHEPGIVLPSLCDLRSGLALNIFPDVETAVLAASLIRDLGWENMPGCGPTPHERAAWVKQLELLRTTLGFHGFAPDPDRHAHDNNGYYIQIITKKDENLAAGKPEKVS